MNRKFVKCVKKRKTIVCYEPFKPLEPGLTSGYLQIQYPKNKKIILVCFSEFLCVFKNLCRSRKLVCGSLFLCVVKKKKCAITYHPVGNKMSKEISLLLQVM